MSDPMKRRFGGALAIHSHPILADRSERLVPAWRVGLERLIRE